MGDAGGEESMLLEVLDWEADFFVTDEASVADPVPFPGTSLQVSTITSNNDDTLEWDVDESKRRTRDLSLTPTVTHQSIETYFCAENTVAYKHKREGYQLFKDDYVKTMTFMPNVRFGEKTCFHLLLHLCEVCHIPYRCDLRRTLGK